MANPYRAEKNITLGFKDDAETYKIAFDPGTVADLETRIGKSVPEIGELLEENRLGFNFLIQAIAAGLQRHHRGRTAAWVSQNFDPKLGGDYALAVIFCFSVACGADPVELEKKIAENKAKAKAEADGEKDQPSGEEAAEEGSETGPDGLPSSSKPSSSESTPSPSGA